MVNPMKIAVYCLEETVKVSSFSKNRQLNKAKGAIRKVAAVTQPLTMVIDEVCDYPSLETLGENDKYSKKSIGLLIHRAVR